MPSLRERVERSTRALLIRAGRLTPIIPPTTARDGMIAEDFDEPRVVREDPPDELAEATILQLAAPDTIRRAAALMLITFRGSSVQPPAKSIVQAEFGKVYDFYEALSFGASYLTGEVFGPFEVERTSSATDYRARVEQAKTKLAATGVDLTRFTNFVAVAPFDSQFGWTGIASVGGNMIYLNGSVKWPTLSHEFGHNFGLSHATAPGVEYGDPFDRMGSGMVGFQAQYRYRIGVLGSGDVVTVTATGRYTLGALEVREHAYPRLIRIPRGDGTFLTVETRRAVGAYALPPTSPSVQGIILRTVDGGGSRSTLIDATPSTYHRTDASLLPGSVYRDPLSGVQVRCIGWYAGYARVGVEFP